MTRNPMTGGVLCLGVLLAPCAAAEPSRPDFHRAVFALHERQIAQHAVRTEVKDGSYQGVAAAGYRYRITRYYDARTGRLLSSIQQDAGQSDAIHIAEVNVYDTDGKLVRDYFSSAPPWRPHHPSHAYINLHHYNDGLHSFRQFELDGRVNYEFCEGDWDGKRVRIALDWIDVDALTRSSPAYRACFDGLRADWARYVAPH